MNIIAARPSEATSPPPGVTIPPRSVAAPEPGVDIPVHYRFCYGCGTDHECGLHMKLTAGTDLSVDGEFLVTDLQQGAPGLAHGGLLAAAFDEVMGATNWLLMNPAVTARLEVDFTSPVPVGETLYLRAAVIGMAGRKVYTVANGRLGSHEGQVAVSARGLFLQVDPAHFTRHGEPSRVHAAAVDKGDNPQRPWLELNP